MKKNNKSHRSSFSTLLLQVAVRSQSLSLAHSLWLSLLYLPSPPKSNKMRDNKGTEVAISVPRCENMCFSRLSTVDSRISTVGVVNKFNSAGW